MVGPKTDVLKFLLGHVRTLRREVHGSKKGALFHTHQTTHHLKVFVLMWLLI